MKTYKGIENPKFKEIKRNRDEGGYILTYSVEIIKGYWAEYNTLAEAKTMAIIVEGDEQ